jgi:26S proteasome regulatory subunit N12
MTIFRSASCIQDDKLFGRNFEQLKAYYTDLHGLLPPSQQEYPILGLNLLRLLAQNRIAEFHVELELLGPEAQGSVHVAFPRQLEQQLMEGLYDKLYRAMQHEKSPHMRVFLSQLQATIRDEAAACAAVVCSLL